jgi:hypothetical protein
MEVEGTLEQLTSLSQYCITSFGEKMGLLNFEQKSTADDFLTELFQVFFLVVHHVKFCNKQS